MAVTAEDRVIAEVKRFCHVGLDETALLGGVAETLRRVIPFDAYCASTTDPASGLMTRTVAEEMGARRKPPSISNMSTSSRTWTRRSRRREKGARSRYSPSLPGASSSAPRLIGSSSARSGWPTR